MTPLSEVRVGISPELRLAICVAGIYTFYLAYGIYQERLVRNGFENTLFLLLVQCAFNAVVGGLSMLFVKQSYKPPKGLNDPAETSPISSIWKHSGNFWLMLISASYLGAMICSNHALQFVSYPTQALGKSCKMIPVMLGNVLLAKKRYSWTEIFAVLLITVGIIVFRIGNSFAFYSYPVPTTVSESSAETVLTAIRQTVGDNPIASVKHVIESRLSIEAISQMDASTYGILLLVFSLTLDGVTGANQKLFDSEYKLPSQALMMHMNYWSVLMLISILASSGEGRKGMEFLQGHPELYLDIMWFTVTSALGQVFIFYTITGPGPLACTTITTTRKFFTILISVLLYPENKLSVPQWVGVALVFSGLGLELLHKYGVHGGGKSESKSVASSGDTTDSNSKKDS